MSVSAAPVVHQCVKPAVNAIPFGKTTLRRLEAGTYICIVGAVVPIVAVRLSANLKYTPLSELLLLSISIE